MSECAFGMAIANPICMLGVRKVYGDLIALRDVDLDVKAGEFLTLLGPSGSGKTTLLMIIAGFTRPDAGSIKLAGKEILLVPPHLRNVGLVFQNYALFPHMNVAENIAFPLRYRGLSRADRVARVRRVLETVRLSGLEQRRIDQLSGGERQRVAVARALVFEPAVLLMDEPLSALDKKLRENMQMELKQLHEQFGTTTIYVTHDQREALTMSSRIAVMNQGEIMQVGKPNEVYERPRNLFVARFMGDSELIRADREPGGAIRVGNVVLNLAEPAPVTSKQLYLLVRPEKVEIVSARASLTDLNTLTARVTHIVYQGEQIKISLIMENGESISVRRGTGQLSLRDLPRINDHVTLGLHPNDTIVVSGE
jgi:putative spermidine/putrescine transport system ATP-binding protein